MAWLRLDDKFSEHGKLLRLGTKADRWTWLELLLYCARQGNSGVIPDGIRHVLRDVSPRFLHRAVEVGLVDETPSGMVIHDWARYNPTDSTNALRQARYRAKRNASRNASRNDPVTDETVTEVTPRAWARAPDPSRPLTNSLSHVGTDVAREAPAQTEREDLEREKAWNTYAASRNDVFSKDAYARVGLESGEWPPGIEPLPARPKFNCDRCVGGMTFKTETKLAEHMHNVHDAD